MNSSSVPALAVQPRSARRSSWRRRTWRGEATTSLPSCPLHVGQAQRRALLPRHRPQRVEVGRHHEVAVAALPRGHRVAVDGVHLDVDREQVVAALGAVVDHLVEEEARACRRLPCSRPCMSVSASRTVSIRPASTSRRSSSRVMAREGICSAPCRKRSVANRVAARTTMARRAPSSTQSRPSSAPLEGEPQPLDGGITNRNFRVRFGGARPRRADVRPGHRAARHRPRRRARRHARRPPSSASGPRSWPSCPSTRAWSRASSPGDADRRRGAARAAALPQVARALRAFHDARAGAADALRRPGDRPRLPRAGARARRRLPDGRAPRRRALARAHRRRAAGPRARAVPCHNDLLGRQLPARRRRAVDRRLGVRRAWATATSTSATCRSTTASTDADDRALLEAYFGRRRARRGASPRCA